MLAITAPAIYVLGLAAAAVLVGLLTGIGSLAIAWESIRTGRREETLDDVADELAHNVLRQWEGEARGRRLNRYPLPVSWRAADAPLALPVGELRALADAWSGHRPSVREEWAREPADLAGEGLQIARLLTRRVPTRRLVVLGRPGAGKTTLLIRLMLELLPEPGEAADPTQPVPVLFPLASWDPTTQELYDWLADRMATDFQGLGSAAPGRRHRSRARALLEERRVLPVLDGFDELHPTARADALERINEELPAGQGVVLSSFTHTYQEVTDPAGQPIRLTGAAAIELLPLPPGVVARYLRLETGAGAGGAAAARWEPVIAELDNADSPVAQALDNPLMVSLARFVYNPGRGERAAHLPDPAELCDTTRRPTAEAVRTHLYDAFVEAAYRPRPRHGSAWSLRSARSTLALLARNLQDNLRGKTDLAWWELWHAAPRALPRFVIEAVGGLVLGVGALCLVQGVLQTLLGDDGLPPRTAVAGVVLFAACNALVGRLDDHVTAATTDRTPARLLWEVRWLPAGIVPWLVGWAVLGRERGLLVGVVCALLTGLTFGAHAAGPAARIRWKWSWTGMAIGLIGGIAAAIALGADIGLAVAACGPVFFFTNGWRAGSADIARAVDPRSLLAQDRRIVLRLIGVVGGAGLLTGGGLGAVVHWLADDPSRGVAYAVLVSALSGAAIGTVVGLIPAWEQGAWVAYTIVRCHFATRRPDRRLPFRLMGFLADAQARGVLRQAGAYYQFRHVAVQRRLAAPDA
jgi:hypothetical protein